MPSLHSATPTSFFIIFFLCFFVHASNGRSIKLKNAASTKEFLSCEIGKKVKPTLESWEPAGIKGLALAEEMKYTSGRGSDDDVVPFRFISLEGSVSRSVPRNKHEKHPGFFSDYSRPRMRPPSHN